MIVVLDSTPVGLLCHPRNPPKAAECRQWLNDLLNAGHRVILPEIIDYETRREFLLTKQMISLQHLDVLAAKLEYATLSTAVMRHAASLWAQVRLAGRPTAASHSLDVMSFSPRRLRFSVRLSSWLRITSLTSANSLWRIAGRTFGLSPPTALSTSSLCPDPDRCRVCRRRTRRRARRTSPAPRA